MVAVAPSSSGIVAVMSASCTAPSGTLESGASVFVDGELGSDDFLLDGEESRCNKPMSERSGRADFRESAFRARVGFFLSRGLHEVKFAQRTVLRGTSKRPQRRVLTSEI